MSSSTRILFFYLTTQVAELPAVNVALNKKGKYCESVDLTGMFDGIRRAKEAEVIREKCHERSFLEILLRESYSIQYVVVYEGQGSVAGQLDYFTVFILNEDDRALCSSYPRTSLGPIDDLGMRLNCIHSNELYSRVRLESVLGAGFSISEIEVHSMGLPDENLLIHRGCFRVFRGVRQRGDLATCQSTCVTGGFLFVAIKNTDLCYCGQYISEEDEVPLNDCRKPCPYRDIFCGGPMAYSVYLLQVPLPVYHGCALWDPASITAFEAEERMTISRCLVRCDNSQYALLTSGKYCSCANSLDRARAMMENGEQCQTNCEGNRMAYCGGSTHVSIYKTCYTLGGAAKCSTLLRCSTIWDDTGRCTGACDSGFIGELCLEKENIMSQIEATTLQPQTESMVCRVSNPCINLTNFVCSDHEGRAKCTCKVGYTLSDSKDICLDMDECAFNPCDEKTSFCENLEGSFNCTCLEGFTRVAEDFCKDSESMSWGDALSSQKYFFMIFFAFPLLSLAIMGILSRCITVMSGRTSYMSQQG